MNKSRIELPKALIDFRDYVYSFYGKHGIYDLGVGIPDIEQAIVDYITAVATTDVEWGGGDSLDRERVRYILETDYGFSEV